MSLPPETIARIVAVARAPEEGFVALVGRATLDKAMAFQGAKLRGLDLRGETLAGFSFAGADLSGADLRGANLPATDGLDTANLDSVITDAATQWPAHGPPPDFNLDEAHRLILAGQEPKPSWTPFITELDLSGEEEFSSLAPIAGLTYLQSLNLQATQVSDLAPIAGLANLQTLNLAGTPVCNLARRIG